MGNKSFILNNVSDLDKLSCHSYDPSTLILINKLKANGIKLDLLKEKIISGPMGFHLHTYDYVPENYPERVKLLQISNIDEFGKIVDKKNDKYISPEKNLDLNKSIVKKGDLIIAKTGTLGRIALFNDKYQANLNQALGIIRFKAKYKDIAIIPEYIHIFLNSSFGLEQFNHIGGYRAGQSGLSLNEITSIYIILPDEVKQKEIIKAVKKERKKAIKHYQNYIHLAEESKLLPAELLNIRIPNEDKRIFINESCVNNRLDAIYNSPFLKKLKNNIKNAPNKKLHDLLDNAKTEFEFNNFYKLIDLDNIDAKSSKIRSFKEVDILKSTKTMFKKGNILISKLGGEKGNIILIDESFDGCVGSGELVPFKLKKNCNTSLEYIFILLRSILCTKQMEYMLTGCSRMRLSKTGMQELMIPMPRNHEEENYIIKSVKNKLDQADIEFQNYIEKKNKMYDMIGRHIEEMIK